jgi:hypothetical protein
MRAMRAISIVCALAMAGIAGTATADQGQQTVKLGGKTLSVVSAGDARMQAKIDDDVLDEDAFIEIQSSFDDGKAGAAVLLVSDGGNGCPGNYIVISVDTAGKAAVTDPFGTCSDTAETSAENGRITVRFAPIAGRDGTVYRWSFAKGLEPAAAEPFQPKPGTSWAEAGGLVGKYPWEALDNADVFAAFKTLLGPDFATFTDYFAKGDPMGATADGIVVGTCFDESSEESTDLLIGIDPNARRVFVALQDGGEAPRFYPPKDQWPASLQDELKQWP